MCDEGEVLTPMLPAPFDVLRVCVDKRRKGRRIITCIDDDWTLHVYLVPSGISILHYAYYFKSITSMIHIQCTNFQYSSVGYLSIGRYRKHQIYKQKKRKYLIYQIAWWQIASFCCVKAIACKGRIPWL